MSQAEIDEFNTFQWEGLMMKGVRVGMPKYINLMTISINKDMFDKYNVAYPPDDGNWTRADYAEMLQNLAEGAKSAGDENVWPGWCPMFNWDRFWGPIHSFGGKIVDEKYGKKCLIAEPEAIEAFQYMYDLEWTTNLHAQPSQVENKWPGASFAPGLIMSCEDGTYPMSRERIWGEEAKIRWDMRHVPKGPRGGRAVLGTTDAWSITKQTQYPEESWDLLRFISGPVFQEKHVVRQAGIIPVLKGLISTFIDTVRSIKPRMADVRLETIKEILDWGYAEDGPWYCDTVAASDIIKPALEAVFTSGTEKPDYFAGVAEQVEASQANCTP
jgi:ABC-type glycerol-3-phosphate transport system substrate-binding protein